MSKLQQVYKQRPAKPDHTDKMIKFGNRMLNVYELKKITDKNCPILSK